MSAPECSPGQYWEGEVVASSLRSASGDSGSLGGFGAFSRAKVYALIESASGSGNLSIFLEDTVDGVNWFPVANSSSTPYTVATANLQISVAVSALFSKTLRVRWVIGGTASPLTFKVNMIARA